MIMINKINRYQAPLTATQVSSNFPRSLGKPMKPIQFCGSVTLNFALGFITRHITRVFGVGSSSANGS